MHFRVEPHPGSVCALLAALCLQAAPAQAKDAAADELFGYSADDARRDGLLTTAELQTACRRVAACPLDHAASDLWIVCGAAGKLDVARPPPSGLPVPPPTPAAFAAVDAGCARRWSAASGSTWTFAPDGGGAADVTIQVGSTTLPLGAGSFAGDDGVELNGTAPVTATMEWTGPAGERHRLVQTASWDATTSGWTVSDERTVDKALTLAAAGGVAILGLADFLLQRSQEEIAAWLSAEVGRELCTGEEAGLRPKHLFPETCALVDTPTLAILAERHLSVLEAAITADLVAFPRHLAEELLRVDKASAIQRQLLVALAVFGRTAELAHDGAPFQEAIGAWARTRPATWRNGERLSLASGSDSQLPAALYLASELIAVAPAFAVVLDGPRVKMEAPDPAPGSAAVATWVTLAHDTQGVAGLSVDATQLVALTARAGAIRTALAQLASRRVFSIERGKFQDLGARLGEAAGDAAWIVATFAEIAGSADLLLPGDAEAQQAVVARVAKAAESARPIAENLAAKRYGAALASLGEALTPKGKNAASPPTAVFRLASVAAAVATADSAEEAREAYRAAVAPVGGYRDKRRTCDGDACTRGYATLNGYVGIGGGTDFQGATLGPVATVGPELGVRLGGTNLALHAFPLDVGQLLVLRLKETDIEPEQIDWREFFAPGLQASLGLGSTPFVIGARGGWTPYAAGSGHLGLVVATDLHLLP